MIGIDYAREALALMASVAGVLLAAAALVWCALVLWLELEPAIRDRLDERDAQRAENPYEWHVQTVQDWRRHR